MIMKLNNVKKALICFGLLSVTVGCTGNFDDINTNAEGANSEVLDQDFGNISGPVKVIFNNVFVQNPIWSYQIQQNLQADLWSGYTAVPTGFAGGSNNSTYNLIDGWNGWAWGKAYTEVMANALKVERLTKSKGLYNQIYAMTLILKVQAMHRITDIYGPIVYSKFDSASLVREYDSQEEVYKQFFADLDEAVIELSNSADSGKATILTTSDKSAYKGDYKQWVKYANSLRLRLAMRIVKINPSLAKTQAEKAISQKYGVLKNEADTFSYDSGFTTGIYNVSNVYGDSNMSADMESILVGYKDPRLAVFFDTSKQFPDKFKGIRNGIEISDKANLGKDLRTNFSKVGQVGKTSKFVWMSYAEVCFLKAEGALRGWNMGGTAQGFYEQGITSSFTQHSVGGSSSYIADNINLPINYVDPIDAVNNGNAVNNITVAWDNVATNEVKLQKIITQKWIAGFPEGQEAWSEHRRTGYPKLLPVVVNKSAGKITTEFGVRRVNFVASEVAANKIGLQTGLAKLGGPDNGGTRLWWDTTGANF
jgi:Susd and RagB outer membrane lipoprotein